MRQTKMLAKESIDKKWLLIDAKAQPLGRLATQIATFLRGKHKAFFTPHNDCGDYVVVVNTAHVVLTGTKWKTKKYYRHSQYPRGLKVETAETLHQRKPSALLWKAVKGMLPKNRLARQQITHLFLYPEQEHKHAAQAPKQVLNHV